MKRLVGIVLLHIFVHADLHPLYRFITWTHDRAASSPLFNAASFPHCTNLDQFATLDDIGWQTFRGCDVTCVGAMGAAKSFNLQDFQPARTDYYSLMVRFSLSRPSPIAHRPSPIARQARVTRRRSPSRSSPPLFRARLPTKSTLHLL
ncbi:hypothetical protein B0J13DRAFT_539876 [Dactylonectria estremocensis]|uniref:Uncharacterized protein n=1 Tax=Dactylonectria estremocensis TaxID=1079267 RepID=A0A9P9FDM6_9HYPO|nr:hypothetical protein B0J13DRAFT_539876 [Dactylonectria estremocensis]